jgi:UDPglucose 6-dehydrogenase
LSKQQISIIGAGYAGLCTAIGFASKGYKVFAVDRDPKKVTLINEGISPFYEIGLETLLPKALEQGNLKCTTNYKEAILKSDITFITVGTPGNRDGSINLTQVENAASEIGKVLKEKEAYHLVVVKSTVVPRTTENIVKPTIEKFSGKDCGNEFGVCVNPEFLREGSGIHDTLHPDRIIIGQIDKRAGDMLESLYRDFYGNEMPPLIRTNIPTAELIKYANNAFLATKISFINEIANICEKIPGVDVTVVAKGIGLDKRIGPLFLQAGLGFGGSCLPKDVKALIAHSKKLGYNPTLLKAVNKINETQPSKAVELCKKALCNLKGKRIALLGLAFKPNTSDVRNAVSIRIIRKLLKEGASITVYDPIAMPNMKKKFKNNIQYASTPLNCIKNADCCILVTEWDEFKTLKPEDFVQNMKQPIVIDGRRIYNIKSFDRKLKFMAVGLGQLNNKPNYNN